MAPIWCQRAKVFTDPASRRLGGKFAESFFDSAFDPLLYSDHRSYTCLKLPRFNYSWKDKGNSKHTKQIIPIWAELRHYISVFCSWVSSPIHASSASRRCLGRILLSTVSSAAVEKKTNKKELIKLYPTISGSVGVLFSTFAVTTSTKNCLKQRTKKPLTYKQIMKDYLHLKYNADYSIIYTRF